MSRVLSTGLFLVGVGLVGVAALNYLSGSDAPIVTIEEPERELPSAVAGETVLLTFRLSNPTRSTVRVVGLADC